MDWVYLWPHLDDVAFSCGGLVWEQTHAGESVSIWTICAGDSPDRPLSRYAQAIHMLWDLGREAPSIRRREDQLACQILGAAWDHFEIPDCIYRADPVDGSFLYTSDQALFGPLHAAEQPLVDRLRQALRDRLPAEARLVCPLTIGGHADHRLTCEVAEGLPNPIFYYADVPYVLPEYAGPNGDRVPIEFPPETPEVHLVSPAGLEAWVQSVAAFVSQLPVFWADANAMAISIRRYWQQVGGIRLWPGG